MHFTPINRLITSIESCAFWIHMSLMMPFLKVAAVMRPCLLFHCTRRYCSWKSTKSISLCKSVLGGSIKIVLGFWWKKWLESNSCSTVIGETHPACQSCTTLDGKNQFLTILKQGFAWVTLQYWACFLLIVLQLLNDLSLFFFFFLS